MSKFKSTKLFDGYSTCFRQWKAEGTHCKFLHGYAMSMGMQIKLQDLNDISPSDQRRTTNMLL